MSRPTTDEEPLSAQFNRLIRDLIQGTLKRSCYRPWEIDLLLDIEACPLSRGSWRAVLQRYRKAVQSQLRNGAATPLKLSDYLATLRSQRWTSPNMARRALEERTGVELVVEKTTSQGSAVLS